MRQKIVALVSIERNAIRILHRSQPLTLNTYSVGTVEKEQLWFEVFDEGKKTLFKISLDALFAIHRKMVQEGMASFEFRKPIPHHMGAFDTIFVFVQKAQPTNLLLFVNNLVAHFQKQRKAALEPPLIRKRNEEAFLASEEAMRAHIAAKPMTASSFRQWRFEISERKVQAAVIRALWFLPPSERLKLGEGCRSLQKFTDAFFLRLDVQNQLQLSIFTKLLQRFKNLEMLKISYDKLLRKPIECKCRMLTQLQELDLSGCGAVKENVIHQLIGFSRHLKVVALPFSSATFSHFCRFTASKERIESFALKGSRVESFAVNSRTVRDFLQDNTCLQVLKLLQIDEKSIPLAGHPVNLRVLKIKYFAVTDKKCEGLCALIAANSHIETLEINHVLLCHEKVNFSTKEEESILESFKSCYRLRRLTIGSFFSDSMVQKLRSWIEENSIDIVKLGICNLTASSGEFLQIIDILPNLQKLDISESSIPTSYLSSHLNANFRQLKKIVLSERDADVRLFREFLEQNRLSRVRVVYKSQ